MSLFQHNNEEVERFIEALRCNPHAVPPRHLDDETIRVIRQLVDHYSPPFAAGNDCSSSDGEALSEESMAAAEQRVWDRVVFATFAPPDVHPSYLSRSAQPTFTLMEPDAGAEADHDAEAAYRAARAAVLPVLSSLPVVYHRQKPDLSFVAVMVLAVFFFTGLLLQQDTLQNDQRHYGSPSKAEMSAPELDAVWTGANPALFIRYQPVATLSERLPQYRAPEEDNVNTRTSPRIPISHNRHYPE